MTYETLRFNAASQGLSNNLCPDPKKNYLFQMLLAINWRYWQAWKKSRMRMKVQGRLMQARFIEIHHVLATTTKMSDTFLKDLVHVNLQSFCNFNWTNLWDLWTADRV